VNVSKSIFTDSAPTNVIKSWYAIINVKTNVVKFVHLVRKNALKSVSIQNAPKNAERCVISAQSPVRLDVNIADARNFATRFAKENHVKNLVESCYRVIIHVLVFAEKLVRKSVEKRIV
jgi:hypothetical protein